jgi:hypothetical protein
VPVTVLDAVEVFDEEVTPARRALEKGTHFIPGPRVDPSPFRRPLDSLASWGRPFFRRR